MLGIGPLSGMIHALAGEALIDKSAELLLMGDNYTYSSGEPFGPNNQEDCNDPGADDYRNQIIDAEPYFIRAGYDVACQSDGNCREDCKNGIWSE